MAVHLSSLTGQRTPAPETPVRDRFGTVVAALRFALPREVSGVVRVTDASGATVRTLLAPRLPAGESCAHWDGLDDRGERVARGQYALRVEWETRVIASRVVTLR